jgi:hypothetical protein
MCRDEGAAGRTAEPIAAVTLFENAHVTMEADILIFDPYKVTATGEIGSGYYSMRCDEAM